MVNNEPHAFTHDHLRQLTLEKTSQYTNAYRNDALNRQTLVNGTKQVHNAVHQLIHGKEGSYKYDAKGRREQDGTIKYTYDKFDRLIHIENENSKWNYSYDAFNRKLSRTFDGEIVYYLYDRPEEIGSYSGLDKNIDLKILSAAEGSIPIAIELGEELYAPLISSQGHIVGLVDFQTGDSADYSPLTMFGKDLNESSLSPWRFCGKRHEEAELGLIDFGFRFYHPKSAQWLTRDPLGESEGPNLYAYVKNSPACFVDRYGLFMDDFSFSNSWSSFKEGCSSFGNAVADNTYRSVRFQGAARAFGGMAESTVGMGIATGGTAASGGLLSPMSISLGYFMIYQGADNFLAGCNQFITGRVHAPLTVQLLQKTGMSNGTASLINDTFGLCNGAYAASKILYPGPKILRGLPSRTEVKFSSQIASKEPICLDKLSNAGKMPDRAGLTKAGRALDKHGNRPNTPFTKATGTPASKNIQGQYHLDDILTHPNRKVIIDDRGNMQLHVPDGRGAYFRSDGSLKGFLDYE